jgi:hypothetical protein
MNSKASFEMEKIILSVFLCFSCESKLFLSCDFHIKFLSAIRIPGQARSRPSNNTTALPVSAASHSVTPPVIQSEPPLRTLTLQSPHLRTHHPSPPPPVTQISRPLMRRTTACSSCPTGKAAGRGDSGGGDALTTGELFKKAWQWCETPHLPSSSLSIPLLGV